MPAVPVGAELELGLQHGAGPRAAAAGSCWGWLEEQGMPRMGIQCWVWGFFTTGRGSGCLLPTIVRLGRAHRATHWEYRPVVSLSCCSGHKRSREFT